MIADFLDLPIYTALAFNYTKYKPSQELKLMKSNDRVRFDNALYLERMTRVQ